MKMVPRYEYNLFHWLIITIRRYNMAKNTHLSTQKLIIYNFILSTIFTFLLIALKYIIHLISNNSYSFIAILIMVLLPICFLCICKTRFYKCSKMELNSMNFSLKILFVYLLLFTIFLSYLLFNFVKILC